MLAVSLEKHRDQRQCLKELEAGDDAGQGLENQIQICELLVGSVFNESETYLLVEYVFV